MKKKLASNITKVDDIDDIFIQKSAISTLLENDTPVTIDEFLHQLKDIFNQLDTKKIKNELLDTLIPYYKKK